MGPKTPVSEGDFFRQPLREQINLKHPLVRLADLIRWDHLDQAMSTGFRSYRGRPATGTRLIAGLLYLQHAFGLSDEEVVWPWVENPYWQVFTGETYLQTKPPVDPSSLTLLHGRPPSFFKATADKYINALNAENEVSERRQWCHG